MTSADTWRYPDFEVQHEGTIVLLHPLTDTGAKWISEHTDPDNRQFFGQALVVEHRYISDLLMGIEADGLRFR